MSGPLIYQILTSGSLLTLGVYHLSSSIRNHLKSPTTFIAKPFHPLPTTTHHRFRHLPLLLTFISLLLHSLHHLSSSFSPDPLLPLHHLSSLHSSAVSLLFSLLSLLLLLSLSTSFFPLLPSPDLFFALASLAFFLQSNSSILTTPSSSSSSSIQLQSHCNSISSSISLFSSLCCLLLALFPKLFFLDLLLSSSLSLHGLWALQTGLSLYVDAFIPEGCHRLLDVIPGVEGSTKCDLDESKLRAVAILDLAFVVHVGVVVVLLFCVYALISKAMGVSRRFGGGGSYEPLPTNSTTSDTNHVQLKTLSGTQA
ncbi:Protein pecanex [Bienertia sinuspersici]